MSDSSGFEQRLAEAGRMFGCDKVEPHGYHRYYATHLGHLAEMPFKLLEIGIGGENRETGGASLHMWRKAFPQAQLYGLDIYPKHELDEPGLATFVVDQGDAAALTRFCAEHGPFDIIIDDGSHHRSDQLTSLFNLIAQVRPGGYYILEDYFTAYWPVYDGSTLARDLLDTPVRWLKQSIDIINRNNLLSSEARALLPDWGIDALHVYPGVAFLHKAEGDIRGEIPNEEFHANQAMLDELRYGHLKQWALQHYADPMKQVTTLKNLRGWLESLIAEIDNVPGKSEDQDRA